MTANPSHNAKSSHCSQYFSVLFSRIMSAKVVDNNDQTVADDAVKENLSTPIFNNNVKTIATDDVVDDLHHDHVDDCVDGHHADPLDFAQALLSFLQLESTLFDPESPF